MRFKPGDIVIDFEWTPIPALVEIIEIYKGPRLYDVRLIYPELINGDVLVGIDEYLCETDPFLEEFYEIRSRS